MWWYDDDKVLVKISSMFMNRFYIFVKRPHLHLRKKKDTGKRQNSFWFIESTSEWQTTQIRSIPARTWLLYQFSCFFSHTRSSFRLTNIIRLLVWIFTSNPIAFSGYFSRSLSKNSPHLKKLPVWIFISDPIACPLVVPTTDRFTWRDLAFKWVPATPGLHIEHLNNSIQCIEKC